MSKTIIALNELNTNQRKAAETTDGPVLINAGPGSGKTRVITYRIAHLVQTCGISPFNIAAVTFTNKAASEMRERLHPIMGSSADIVTVSTFHSFCSMLLRIEGHNIGLSRDFVIYDSSDQLSLVKRSMKEVDVDAKQFSPQAILSKISSTKNELNNTDPSSMSKNSYFDEIVSRVYEKYESSLNSSSAVDFDDLLLNAHAILKKIPEVADKYQTRYMYVMVDEFQDTNLAQYEIAKLLSLKHRNLCVVGDPDQSIYSWRNADIRNIFRFQKDFPEATVIPLEENYRSSQTILDAAQNLIKSNSERVEKKLWTNNSVGIPISVGEGYNEKEEAYQVVSEIGRLIREETYGLSNIAIMYRVNAQSRAIEDACMLQGLQYQLVGSLRFYHRQEIKDVVAYLRLIANRNDDVSFLRVVNMPTRGIGQKTLNQLMLLANSSRSSLLNEIKSLSSKGDHSDSLSDRSVNALRKFESLIDELTKVSESLKLPELIDHLLDETNYKKHVLADIERGQDRWDNLQELRNTADEYTETNSTEALTPFLESISLVSDIDNLDDQTDALTLVTLHQSKGLEFPVVFIVGMEEGLLPHIRSLEDESEIEEERRLCYVGLTRAKERLYLQRAFRRGFRGSSEPSTPSRFLAEIPRELFGTKLAKDAPSRSSTIKNGTLKSKHTRKIENPDRDQSLGKPFELKTGDKVRHKIFGEGIITNTKPSGEDMELTVAFNNAGGVKRLLQSFAPLEKI